jgi:hypothetical protein
MLRNLGAFAVALAGVLTWCELAVGQETPPVGASTSAGGQVHSDAELTRQVLATERQAIVANALDLSGKQSEDFWPLYREYDADRAKLGERRIRILLAYEEAYPNLSTGEASQMTREVLDVQAAEIELKKRYLDRFRKVLGEIQTARFYQVERKLDAAENMELAKSIPLVW